MIYHNNNIIAENFSLDKVFTHIIWLPLGYLYDGNIWNNPFTFIVLSGHYSVVSIELKQEATGAKLSLLQTEVPEAECERTKEGWRRHIFEAIKTTFGFGAHLF